MRWAPLALLFLACAGASDHEGRGDRRYAERAFADALAEYRLAARQRSPSPALRTKLAMAAQHAGELAEAVEQYRSLGALDPAAAEEAADGLERVARRAADSRDVAALRKAVAALREIAPDRPVGLIAAALGSAYDPEARPADALDILLQEAAAQPVRETADSILVVYGQLLRSLAQCDAAARVFRGVIRRAASPLPPPPSGGGGPGPAAAREARRGLATCAVDQGRQALGTGLLADAEAWFRRAVEIGEPDSVVREAWLLVGDARWTAGDAAGALEAYRRATIGAPVGDEVAARAMEQMLRIQAGGIPER